MTTIRHPALFTNDASLPIIPAIERSELTYQFAALPNRLAWLEAGDGLLANGNWYDRLPAQGKAAAFTVAGALTVGGALSTGRKGAIFDGSQTVPLGNIFPTSADYTIFAAYKQGVAGTTGVGTSGGMGLVSSAAADGSSYRSLHLTSTASGGSTTGAIQLVHGGSVQFGDNTARATNTLHRLSVKWVQLPTKTRQVRLDGSTLSPASGAANTNNTLASAVVGSVGNLGANFNFLGTLYHLSIFGTMTDANLAVAESYLAEQFV